MMLLNFLTKHIMCLSWLEQKLLIIHLNVINYFFKNLLFTKKKSFSIRVFFHGHWQLMGQQGREGTIFYSTLPFSPVLKRLDIYLRLCMWDDYYIILIAQLVCTRLPLDEIYHLVKLLFNWLIMWCWFSFVCLMIWFEVLLQLFEWETGGLELASSVILVLQANRLTKCTSYPDEEDKTKVWDIQNPWKASVIRKSSKQKQSLYEKFLKARNQKTELEY